MLSPPVALPAVIFGLVGVLFFLLYEQEGSKLHELLQQIFRRFTFSKAGAESRFSLGMLLHFCAFAGDSNFPSRLKQAQGGDDEFNSTGVCGYIFQREEPAFICRTCGVDETCIQCPTCFQNSDHRGHDTRMTYSGGGGCCDCGDTSSWALAGCCSRHQGLEITQSKKKYDVKSLLVPKVGDMALRGTIR